MARSWSPDHRWVQSGDASPIEQVELAWEIETLSLGDPGRQGAKWDPSGRVVSIDWTRRTSSLDHTLTSR